MMDTLNVVAVASSEEARAALYSQLKSLDVVTFDGVLIELSDAARTCIQKSPDVIIVDLTGRELDGGLFIETISMNPDKPCVIFALHRELNHQIILEAVRRGAKEFIQYPEDPQSLETALLKHLTLLRRVASKNAANASALEKPQGKLYTVFSSKGGSGSSTLAVNLAHELHQMTGEGVVLFDLDQVFSNTAVLLNLKPNYSLGDLAATRPEDLDEQVLRRVVVRHESGLDVVVGTKSVLDDNEMISAQLLESVLDFLQKNYRYIVADLPTHVLDPYHQFMVERADEVLLLSSLDIPGLYRTRQYLDLARQYLDEGKLKLVLNRCNLRAAYGMTNKALEDEFHHPVFARLANDWEITVEASSLGCVLSKVNPSAELVKNIRALAKQLTGAEATEALPAKKRNGGLLGKLFSGGSHSLEPVQER